MNGIKFTNDALSLMMAGVLDYIEQDSDPSGFEPAVYQNFPEEVYLHIGELYSKFKEVYSKKKNGVEL